MLVHRFSSDCAFSSLRAMLSSSSVYTTICKKSSHHINVAHNVVHITSPIFQATSTPRRRTLLNLNVANVMTRLWTATTSAWLRRRGARLTSTQSQLSSFSSYDLVVIGSGPSATQCALDSAKQGKRVAIVDKKTRLGGVCVHTGTIPSKTFREAVLHLSGYRHHGFYGKSYSMKTVTIEDILYRVQRVVSSEEDVVRAQLKAARVDVIPGFARFESAHEISIVKEGAAKDKAETGQCSNNMDARTRVRADKFLVACGTRPAHNPLVPIDGKIVIDSDQILKRGMQQLPRSLIVVGAGVIGMEYASMINVVPGHSVTVVDARPDVSCST